MSGTLRGEMRAILTLQPATGFAKFQPDAWGSMYSHICSIWPRWIHQMDSFNACLQLAATISLQVSFAAVEEHNAGIKVTWVLPLPCYCKFRQARR